MADGCFGCEADMAGPAAGSTRSLVTHFGSPAMHDGSFARRRMLTVDASSFDDLRLWAG